MKKKELKEWLADKIGDLMTLYDQYLDESTIYCGADFYGAKVYKYKEKEMLDFILQEINKAREGEKQNGWEECEAFYGDMRKILRPYHKEGEDYRNTLKRLLSKLKE